MTLLSININKFALLRNARGTDYPNLINITKKCIEYGAQGITVHPRPDERHIKFSDLPLLANLLKKINIEFNIEGYPSDNFCKTINSIKPNQVTLVPDPPNALTSSFGWDLYENKKLLEKTVKSFQSNQIRVSLFVDPSIKTLENLPIIKPNRVELHTFEYSKNYHTNSYDAIKKYKDVVNFINDLGNIDINAGHDLNLNNLEFLLKEIPCIKEVSIGHALVCDAINYGLEKTIKKYLSITDK